MIEALNFEEVAFHIANRDLLDTLEHLNQERYRNQRIFVVQREDNVFLVAFVEDNAIGGTPPRS